MYILTPPLYQQIFSPPVPEVIYQIVHKLNIDTPLPINGFSISWLLWKDGYTPFWNHFRLEILVMMKLAESYKRLQVTCKRWYYYYQYRIRQRGSSLSNEHVLRFVLEHPINLTPKIVKPPEIIVPNCFDPNIFMTQQIVDPPQILKIWPNHPPPKKLIF